MDFAQKKLAVPGNDGKPKLYASFVRRILGDKGYLKIILPEENRTRVEALLQFETKPAKIVVWVPQGAEAKAALLGSVIFDAVVRENSEPIIISFQLGSKLPDVSTSK